jgi:hypothetical protein
MYQHVAHVWFGLPVSQLSMAVAEDGSMLRLQQRLIQTPTQVDVGQEDNPANLHK